MCTKAQERAKDELEELTDTFVENDEKTKARIYALEEQIKKYQSGIKKMDAEYDNIMVDREAILIEEERNVAEFKEHKRVLDSIVKDLMAIEDQENGIALSP